MLLFWEYIFFGGGGVSYCYLGPCIQKVVWIPVVPIFPPISHDFCYNIKYSPLKLFCTISCLCEGTLLRQLWLNLFWSTLPRVPGLTIAISQFFRQDNIIRVNVHIPWAHFSFQHSHPSYILRTPSPSIYKLPRIAPCLIHAILHRSASLEEN